MRYTMEALDTAIDKLLPKIAEGKKNGIHFNRPILLDMIASDFFVKDWDNTWNPSYEERICYFICQEALFDLKTKGFMDFGNDDLKL